jgi:gliding motility-associated-like protein
LVAIDKYGCKNEDSIRVNIDYRDHLMVPSAFSPNGDGRNDDFKVANLTFQRVIEFRVLNRWGQEVYYAANNKPWDGTWKGVPQDMGTYSYFIKVAYPDGIIETYKGEVTLVR